MPRVGDASPKGVSLTVTSTDIDLTTVDSPVSLTVHRPSGSVTWSWTVASSSEDEAVLEHTFAADGSDTTDEGNYAVEGTLCASSSPICQIETFFIPVTP